MRALSDRGALKPGTVILRGAWLAAFLVCYPAAAAEASGNSGLMVSDATGRPALPPRRPSPPPLDPPFKFTKDGGRIVSPSVTITKDGDMIVGGGPEKGGYIATKDGTRITKDFITTEKETGGVRIRASAHRKTGMKEVCTKDPDGSVSQETRYKDGGVISRVSWSKNGKLVEYEPWMNDAIFDSAQRVLEARYHSVGEQTTVQLQSAGKVNPGGTGILVRSEYRERSGAYRELGKTSSSTLSQDTRMKTEIRKLKLDRDSRFAVMEVLGGTMRASGWGKTRDEAFASALDQIASEIMIHVRSEMIDYQATTRTRTAKGTTASGVERVEDKLDTHSKAAFKVYRIVAVRRDGDQYTVTVEAVPGAVVPRPPALTCGYVPGLGEPAGSDRPTTR